MDELIQREDRMKSPGMAAVVVAVALLAIELVARLVALPPWPHDPSFVEAREWSYPDHFVKDPELFWRFRPNRIIRDDFLAPGTYTINSDGFRGASINSSKPAGVQRVVCVGDGTTFGWGVSDSASYPPQLEIELNRLDPQHRRWDVINAGMPDYSTYQAVILARRWLPRWKPDIVLYNFSWGDHQPVADGMADGDRKMPPAWLIGLEDVLMHSAAVRWARWGWLSFFAPDSAAVPVDRKVWRVGLTEFVSNMEKLIRTAEDVHARPVIVTSPISWPPPGKSDTSGVFHYHQMYRRMARYGAIQNGAEYVELANAFDAHPAFFEDSRRDNEHFNAAGHAFAGEFLARFILGAPLDTTDSRR